MLHDKRILAIIPARGGSKRLPKKNILPLCGKPLIQWTIEAAMKATYLDTIVVSSDDDDVLNLANESGVIALRRPDELASDTASSFSVVKHAITTYADYDLVVLLQPTSPLRNAQHITEALELYMEKNAKAIISVCEVDHSPLWCNTLPADRSMFQFLQDGARGKRSQDLETYYRLNGAIYICNKIRLLEEASFFLPANIFAYVMDTKSSVDIDEDYDFKLAEVLIGIGSEENHTI